MCTLPQTADVHVDHVGLRVEMIVPHALEQHGARHHLPAVAHHELQQLEFARREFDFLAVAHDPARHPVEFQIRQFQSGVRFRAAVLAASRERVDARQQLRHVIRLGQVIVAAGAKARDAIVDVAERAQYENRHLAPRRAQRLHQGESIQLRQHAIDDRQIDGDRGREVQPLETVPRNVDRVSHLSKRFGEVIACNFVIFDNQDVHGLLSYRRWTRVCRHDRLKLRSHGMSQQAHQNDDLINYARDDLSNQHMTNG